MRTLRTFAASLALGLALASGLRAAAPEPGVVDLGAAPAGPADDEARLLDAKGSTRWPQALQAFLALHPHGLAASRALREQAALSDDLAESTRLLRRARDEGAGREEGSQAALALSRLDYAQGRPEAALEDLVRADDWPRPASMQDEWLYWRAQCRLVLKGYRQAREDLRRLLTVHPDSPRAEAALAARADCDSHLKDDAAAEAAWTRLAGSQGAYAAQALWGLAELRQRQGRRDDALRYFRRLVKAYPASFEAQAAPARMAALAKAPVAKAVTRAVKRRWWVQVGAFSRQAAAVRMVKGLKAHRWAARSTVRVVDGQRLYFVTVGPYGAKAKALAAGRSLHAKEKLDQHLVEE